MSFEFVKRSNRSRRSLAAAAALALGSAFGPARTLAAGPSQFAYYFNNTVSLQGGTGALGGFAYTGTASNPQFYTLGFVGSTQGIYQDNFNSSNSSWSSSLFLNNQTSGTNDWLKFALSSSVTDNGGNGTIVSTDSATPTVGDMVLNPATVTVGGITYAPGTLGIIIDGGKTKNSSGVVQPSLSKLVYAYDLRAVTYSSNPSDPRYLQENNPAVSGYNDHNGDGYVEWNDVFTPIVSFADELSLNPGVTSSTNTVTRRPAFSTDGQSIYFTDTTPSLGGIYKVNITQTGASAITKILQAPSGTALYEPIVVSSGTRNFGGGAGDQLVISGTVDTGNVGGISYLVDNGTTVSAPQTLLSAKQIAWFLDQPNGGSDTLNSYTTDSSGNLYVENSATSNYGGVFEYDAQGRLVKLFSQGEQRWFEYTESTPVNFNGSVLELKLQPVNVTYPGSSSPTTINQLLYRDTNTKAPVGVNVYLPGDFNHDGVVNSTDIALFKQQLGLRGVASVTIGTTTGSLPVNSTADGSAYAASGQATLAENAGVPFLYDLNGSVTGTNVTASVDWKDAKIFQQFAGFSDGDVNMDGSVNFTDLNTLASNYGLTNKIWTDGKLSSVRINATDANTVGLVDLVTEAANWPVGSLGKPALAYNASGGVDLIAPATLDRAFAITSGGTISQIAGTSSGMVNWSAVATWTNGDGAHIVPNSAGAVASLLNKATNDTIVNVDGSYSIGQLNFDNYFTYTVSGVGLLHMAGKNGTGAEINTFAASPILSVAMSLDSPTNITVNYSTDTATFSGPISGSDSLNKLGAGTVLLSGGNSYVGGTNVSMGTLQVQGPASLPHFTTAGEVAVASGAALVLNIGGSSEWNQPDFDSLRAAGSFAPGSYLGMDTTDAAGSVVLSSNISGSFGFIKQGSNLLQLTGINTYTGGTSAIAGTLEASTPGSLPLYTTAGNVVVASGASLAVNVGGSGEWTSANIDALRASVALSAGATIAIDTTDASGGFTYASIISGANVGFSKLGPNMLTLTGNSTYNGSTGVLGGTLQLGFAAASAATNIINASSGLIVQSNGALIVLGKASTTNSQTFAGVVFNPGSNAIVATASTSNPLLLTLGAITRTVGSTVDFTLPAGTQGATNGISTSTSATSGTLGGWATVVGADWATKSASNIVALAAGSYTADAWSSANNTTVTASSAPALNSSTNTLRFNLPGAYTLTLAGVNNIATGGILVAPAVGAHINNISGGILTGKSGADLVINQFDTSGNFEIDSIIADSTTATALTKSGGGLLTLSAANTYTGPTYVNAGSVNVSAGSLASTVISVLRGATLSFAQLPILPSTASISTSGAVNFGPGTSTSGPAAFTLGNVSIGNGGAVTLADAGAGNHANRSVLTTSNLVLAGGFDLWGGKLDLAGNDLIVHNGSLATLTNQIETGLNGGAGVTSSTAVSDTTHLTTLGLILNNDGTGTSLYGGGGSLGRFDGLDPTVTDVLVKYTYFGDANLDGKVDGSDYARIDNGYLSHLTGWYNGDFNYDGTVDGSDYTLIDNAFNSQGVVLSSEIAVPAGLMAAEVAGATPAVPEPASIAVLGLGAIGVLARRRRA